MKKDAYRYQPLVPVNTVMCQRQRGLTLVELMISLVIGLILVAAVFNMYTGNVRSARFTEGVQAIQENGRYGVAILQRGLRLAGFSEATGLAGEIDAFDMGNSGASRLTIQARQPYDCNGLPTTSTNGLAVNTYSLNAATNELMCRGNQPGSTDMAIIEGVEQFQLLYGIDEDGDDRTCEPQRYVPYSNALKSSEIVALRFALLVNSDQPIRTRNASETFVLLDQMYTNNPPDRLAREVFSGTVLLRNNTSCTNT